MKNNNLFEENLFIAEIGVNHCGSLDYALKHIEEAKKVGFGAVKFQFIDINRIWHKDANPKIKLSKKESFQIDWFKPITDYAHSIGMLVGHTPTFQNASQTIKEYESDFIKIASPQAEFDKFILEEAIETNLPLVISNGYSNYNSSVELINFLENSKLKNSNIAFLYCIAKYPADNVYFPYSEAKKIYEKCKEAKINFGFSDHYKSILPALNLKTFGATVFEKHFSLDDVKSLDSEVSVTKETAKEYIKQIKMASTEQTLKRESTFLKKEIIFCSNFFFRTNVKKNDLFSISHFDRFRLGNPNSGLLTNRIRTIIANSKGNLHYSRDFYAGEMLKEGDII